MRNKLFEQALSLVPEKTKQKIKNYTDMIDNITLAHPGRGYPLSIINDIIQDAYKLGMPQVESEIMDLARFIQKDIFDKREDDPFYQYNVLEIGTKFGGTFYIWNKLNELTNGKNISIDMHDGGLHGGVGDDAMDKRDLWFSERFNNCYFIRDDSHKFETKLEVINLISKYCQLHDFGSDVYLNTEFFDFIFIDGDHTYEGVKQDFLNYSPFCKTGSVIAFHDIIDSQRHRDRNVYVAKFWNELISNVIEDGICSYNGQLYAFKEFIGSKDQDWAGIGILIKLQ